MQQNYFGANSLSYITTVLEQQNPSSIILVHGKTSYHQCGAAPILTKALCSYSVNEFTDFSSNPLWEEVTEGIKLWKSVSPSLVIAVGGGSCIDTAKAVTILAEQSGSPVDYLEKRRPFQPRHIPLVAIPTTSGTGSEATHFATVYQNKEKHSIAHHSLLPDYAIVDPALTLSLSAYTTACTGVDALTQAIESYWSTNSTEESKQYATQAISLALQHLETAVSEPNNIISRTGMAQASNLAGKAINISKTTACHAISYPLTAHFDIPHGHAVALTLPQMVVYNSKVCDDDCGDARGVHYLKSLFHELSSLFSVSSVEGVRLRLEELMGNIRLEQRLTPLGVCSEEHIDLIIENAFNPERVNNNPRLLTEESLRDILNNIK